MAPPSKPCATGLPWIERITCACAIKILAAAWPPSGCISPVVDGRVGPRYCYSCAPVPHRSCWRGFPYGIDDATAPSALCARLWTWGSNDAGFAAHRRGWPANTKDRSDRSSHNKSYGFIHNPKNGVVCYSLKKFFLARTQNYNAKDQPLSFNLTAL